MNSSCRDLFPRAHIDIISISRADVIIITTISIGTREEISDWVSPFDAPLRILRLAGVLLAVRARLGMDCPNLREREACP